MCSSLNIFAVKVLPVIESRLDTNLRSIPSSPPNNLQAERKRSFLFFESPRLNCALQNHDPHVVMTVIAPRTSQTHSRITKSTAPSSLPADSTLQDHSFKVLMENESKRGHELSNLTLPANQSQPCFTQARVMYALLCCIVSTVFSLIIAKVVAKIFGVAMLGEPHGLRSGRKWDIVLVAALVMQTLGLWNLSQRSSRWLCRVVLRELEGLYVGMWMIC